MPEDSRRTVTGLRIKDDSGVRVTQPGADIYRLAAFAEFERQTLIRRTKEGMPAAKLRHKHIGRSPEPILEEVVLAHSRM